MPSPLSPRPAVNGRPLHWRAALAVSAACILAAIGLLTAVPMLFGSPLRAVNVSWHHLVPGERVELEQRFRLSEGAHLGGARWLYVPLDVTPERLEQLAHHPKVAFVDGIDRRTFRLAVKGPLTTRRGGLLAGAPPRAARGLKLAAYGLMAIGMAFALLGVVHASGRQPLPALRDAAEGWRRHPRHMLALAGRAGASAIERGIPVASPQAAGVFRIVFGTLVVACVLQDPVYPALLTAHEVDSAAGPYGSLLRWLRDHPSVVESLPAWLAAFGALFVAGVGTTVTFAGFVGAFMVWASIHTVNTTHHAVSSLALALICLLPARWSEACSVDAWLRRGRRRDPVESRRYGYATWVPVFVLGLTFALAAASKLRGGLDWILNGTVKYHFASDYAHALVPWGVWLTRYQPVAVVISAAAVLTEGLVLTAAFSKSDRQRAVAGAGAACLLAGFALFQGVIWPGWWVLLLGFLPWHRLRGRAPVGLAVTVPQRATLAALALTQAWAWLTQVEARPLISAYDMYSVTYDGDEAYEAARALSYRVVVSPSDDSRTELNCPIDYATARVLTSASEAGSADRARVRTLLDPCFRDVRGPVVLEGYREVFNWQSTRFELKRQPGEIGPLAVDWLWDGR